MTSRPRRRPLCGLATLAALAVALPACAGAARVPNDPPVSVGGACLDAEVPSAAQFVDSVGVATHLSYLDTPYADLELVRRSMVELGVRHYRDGWRTDDDDLMERALDLGRDGLRVTFVHDPREGGTPAQQHARVRDRLLPVLEAAESLNEPDTRGGDWERLAVEWTTQLSQAYRSDPRTRTVPVIAPALSLLEDEDDHRALSALQGLVDHGNAHDYPGKDLEMDDRILDLVQRHTRLVAGDVPPVVTETGYSDGPGSAPYQVMSPEAIAVLTPRLLLEHFRSGVRRTFLYELLDEKPGAEFEAGFGLVEHDGRPKPAYRSLQSLLATLSAQPQRCDQLPLELDLDDRDSQLRSLVLRGGEGTYQVALWRQVPVWDPVRALDDPPVDVAVRVRNPVAEAVAHVPHLRSSQPLPVRDGVVTVPVSGAVTLLELSGVGLAPPASSIPASGPVG